MKPAKTPEQIAQMFGCTVEQARAQTVATIKMLRTKAEKARANKNGMLRGLTVEWYEERAKAFEAVL